jgi:hypothetical protein
MFNHHRMVLLGLIVAQGSNLVAGEQPKVNLSSSGKELKIVVAMVVLEKKNHLSCSAEVRQEKRDFESSIACCGSGKAPYYGIPHSIMPYYPEGGYSSYFPGAKYNPLNFK